MNIETISGMTVISAENGYFLTNNNGIYGEKIYLGNSDSPENYEELPLEEYPVIEEPEEIEILDSSNENIVEEETFEEKLQKEKNKKIQEIEEYDFSSEVNGFFYNGQLMWLDRITRSVIVNNISSSELLGKNEIDIWYKDILKITLDCQTAKYLLANIELYATECYNVTTQHKIQVKNLETIEEVRNFDIRKDYPERLVFDTTSGEGQ